MTRKPKHTDENIECLADALCEELLNMPEQDLRAVIDDDPEVLTKEFRGILERANRKSN